MKKTYKTINEHNNGQEKSVTNKNQNKTVATKVTWQEFLKNSDLNDVQKKQAEILVKLFEKVTGSKCIMWGQIFGFGTYHYIYDSKREADWMASAFAMRKNGIIIYLIMGFPNSSDILKDLGKYKISGKSCLNIKNLDDVNLKVLEKLVKLGLVNLKKKYKVTK